MSSEEYFWGCELSTEKPSVTWSIQEEEDEEDSDYVNHILFLKHAVLGSQAVKDEVNIVTVETQNYGKEVVKQPFINLCKGECSMVLLDVSFHDSCPVTFTLTEGKGPVYISAMQLVEFPDDGDMTVDEEGMTEEEDELEEEEETPEKKTLKAKRKGGPQGSNKAKRSKMEAAADEDDDEDDSEEDEDEDEEMEDDDDEDDEPSPEKKPNKKKKAAGGGKNGSTKKNAASDKKPKKAAKAGGKKVKK